jgi:integrase/recombinase XerD
MDTKTSLELLFTTRDVHQDFMVSREAIGISKRTYKTYEWSLEKFYTWLEGQGIYSAKDALTTKTITGFLAALRGRTTRTGGHLSDRYIHIFARTIKTLSRFAYEEKYIPDLPTFKMPPIRKKRLLYLDTNDIPKVLDACNSTRDLALLNLAIASGLRLSEIISLDWRHISLRDGKIIVLHGKGDKYRVSMVDKGTLRILIRYHNELKILDADFVAPDAPLIQTDEHTRMKPNGVRSIMDRISTRSGVKMTAHALRRTFARLSVKNGMDIVWLQQLLGHENIETTKDYVGELDVDDIAKFYEVHAPLRDIKR